MVTITLSKGDVIALLRAYALLNDTARGQREV